MVFSNPLQPYHTITLCLKEGKYLEKGQLIAVIFENSRPHTRVRFKEGEERRGRRGGSSCKGARPS
jgi:hypothetical protein